ncbi:hypothetical protein HJB79_32210 [Rhizobium lentis]|uniref:hypothetical protein n=1 Tax=Rhizobium lentis TaxID=1138194 RepID=UPI001C83DAC0|nr:hypothetical protein [Rhizobium lentis]MBX5143363.1 hypothetical protein [Rhizobium lentis]
MSKHTLGPWLAEMTKGWGGDLCIVAEGSPKPIFKAIKPDAYYTDYMPTRDGGVILSDDVAARNGRYVATKETKERLDEIEAANARLIAAAPELLEALKAMLPEANRGDQHLRPSFETCEAARAAIAEDDVQLFRAKLADATRRRAHWQRRIEDIKAEPKSWSASLVAAE